MLSPNRERRSSAIPDPRANPNGADAPIGTFASGGPAGRGSGFEPMISVNGMSYLTREECLELLEGTRLGRVSVSIGALPAILPVNYAVSDDAIVFRTAPGTKLSAAVMGSVVGFEIDGGSDDGTAGWSVLVVGRAIEVREPSTIERLRALPLRQWAPGDRDNFVRIPLTHVSGRAFGAAVDRTA
jgi:nitroimidazol reductase NimA-like FMN-containing flavoprotein (pyridoxamine 5'-phosphate oxidase superfamily)